MARTYTLNTPGPASGGADPDHSRSSVDYQAELNPQQYAAVTASPGPALVIAGAGSGKTRTLTYRVAWLLDNGIPARNILLLTFTNKAAREMLDRVSELVGSGTRDLWGGTFHSIGNRILRRDAEELGYRPNYSIMDRDDQKQLMTTVVEESEVDTKAMRFPKPQLLCDMFSLAINTGVSVEEIIEQRYEYFEHLTDTLVKIRDAYEDKKLATNSMDFDDLLVKCLKLLRQDPQLTEYYQRRFEFVLVDEYQDTNSLQAELIDLFARPQKNLMVVGDDAQSIYSWRGANFRNILDFPDKYQGAQVFKIETNYRSVPKILTLANEAIRHNHRQFPKELEPDRPDRETLPAVVAVNDPSTQAAFVGQRIAELQDAGTDLKEIAVVYRAHFHAMEIQMELTTRGIPFVITSGLRFFEQAHIKDVAAFMKLVTNRQDEIAFRRLVLMLPGIGVRSADKLWAQWKQTPLSDPDEAPVEGFSKTLIDFKVSAKAKKHWQQLCYTLDELVDPEGVPLPPVEMMPCILEGAYLDYLKSKYSNADERLQDIVQLEQYSEGFDTMEEFLSQLSLLAGTDTDETAKRKGEQDDNAVVLSSVHQAKGLEWNVVFVVWLAEGMFPNNRVLEEDNHGDDGLEEERRLFYVAVTRAKDELYLTWPMMWPNAHSGNTIQRPSRFLDEIPEDCVEEWQVGRGW